MIFSNDNPISPITPSGISRLPHSASTRSNCSPMSSPMSPSGVPKQMTQSSSNPYSITNDSQMSPLTTCGKSKLPQSASNPNSMTNSMTSSTHSDTSSHPAMSASYTDSDYCSIYSNGSHVTYRNVKGSQGLNAIQRYSSASARSSVYSEENRESLTSPISNDHDLEGQTVKVTDFNGSQTPNRSNNMNIHQNGHNTSQFRSGNEMNKSTAKLNNQYRNINHNESNHSNDLGSVHSNRTPSNRLPNKTVSYPSNNNVNKRWKMRISYTSDEYSDSDDVNLSPNSPYKGSNTNKNISTVGELNTLT